jgi:hypothetical protein
MDLDDVVKYLVPKRTRKKWKKRLKKEGVLGVLRAIWREMARVFGEERNGRKRKPTSSPPTKSADPDDPLHNNLAQARTYQARIAAMAQAADPDSMERLRLEQLSARINEWVRTIEAIVARAVAHREDALLAAERKRVPQAIKRLEKQLAETEEGALRRKLERTLANRRKQLAQLEQAANGRQMAELKVENTLAQLGIIYSQLHNGRYMLERSGYERLAAEITDEVQSLDDYLATLNDLQQENAAWR